MLLTVGTPSLRTVAKLRLVIFVNLSLFDMRNRFQQGIVFVNSRWQFMCHGKGFELDKILSFKFNCMLKAPSYEHFLRLSFFISHVLIVSYLKCVVLLAIELLNAIKILSVFKILIKCSEFHHYDFNNTKKICVTEVTVFTNILSHVSRSHIAQ